MIDPTDEMVEALLRGAEGTCLCGICARHRIAAVLAIAERDQQPAARKGYETAIAVLRGVAERSGSPAFIFCADYLLADPDRLAPPPQERKAHGEQRFEVVTWDWREQPDWQAITSALTRLSGGGVHIAWPETGTDQYAVVLSDRPFTAKQAAAAYRAGSESATQPQARPESVGPCCIGYAPCAGLPGCEAADKPATPPQ